MTYKTTTRTDEYRGKVYSYRGFDIARTSPGTVISEVFPWTGVCTTYKKVIRDDRLKDVKKAIDRHLSEKD